MNIIRFGYRPVFSSIFDQVIERAATEPREMTCKPAANVRESEKEYQADIILPGFEKEEILVTMEKNVLVITAKHEAGETEGKVTLHEFSRVSSFRRSFELPENANTDEIKAEYRNGILHVSIPKVEPKQEPVKQITIG